MGNWKKKHCAVSLILLLLCMVAFSSCKRNREAGMQDLSVNSTAEAAETAGAAASAGTTDGREYIIQAQRDEEALERISKIAQDTFTLFIRHLQRPGRGEDMFRVKYPFPADRESGFSVEHLWLKDIRFIDGRYYGVVTNQPFYISAIKAGDQVPFQADEISDWMYRKDGYIIGGLSIRYFISGIPELDRDEVLSAYYLRFQPENGF